MALEDASIDVLNLLDIYIVKDPDEPNKLVKSKLCSYKYYT